MAVAVDWLVTFDVSDDRARRVVTRALQRYGYRVAYSVFIVRADGQRMDRLLTGLVDAVGASGHLLALPCCAQCEVAVTGVAIEVAPRTGWVAW
ncbi:MAG: CRISPR-associated endonuclease Cas2 [Sciscionella sp.]